MPDALELPGVLGAVVPLVRGEGFAGVRGRVVGELVALAGRHGARRGRGPAPGRLPRLAAVARALDHLPEPAARLRGVQPVGVGRRALEVVDLPTGEVGAADVPLLALAVRCQDECAFPCAHQHSYLAHPSLLPESAYLGLEPRLYPSRRMRIDEIDTSGPPVLPVWT